MLTDENAISRSHIARHFVIGPDYLHPVMTVKCLPSRAIELAAELKERGVIWMQYNGGYPIVANYDGKGGVFNGQAQIVPAKPEDMIVLAHYRG